MKTIISKSLLPKTLYHATLYAFNSGIRARGIVPGGECQLYYWCSKKFVYLSDDPNLAKSFVSTGVIETDSEEDDERLLSLFESGGMLIEIDTAKLNLNKLEKDPNWNVAAEDSEGKHSYAYAGIIPVSAIRKYTRFDTD